MELKDLLRYKHVAFSYKPNKMKMPINKIELKDYQEFNAIEKMLKENDIWKIKPTKSGGMPYNNQYKYNSRYFVKTGKLSFEMVIVSLKYGCYRFVVANKTPDNNNVSGGAALREIIKKAKETNTINIFRNNTGNFKDEIESPIIKAVDQDYLGKEFEHCNHLDFKSSYASRICERWPELRVLYKPLFDMRKDNNDYYKHVLTNSIGKMQSDRCIDIFDEEMRHTVPFQLSKFAKTAINGTNAWINYYLIKLKQAGRKPLLINTDGIWYQGAPFHDEHEGTDLGQWTNDHINVKLYIKTAGAYQYIEDNKVKTVLRGTCALDAIKSRDQFTWREIDLVDEIVKYKYDEEKGEIIKLWEKL